MKDPRFIQSLEQYHEDLENEVKKNPVGSYYHLTRSMMVNAAKDEAWWLL